MAKGKKAKRADQPALKVTYDDGHCEQFFVTLQFDVKDWISLGTTKTGMIYRMNGNAPQSVE